MNGVWVTKVGEKLAKTWGERKEKQEVKMKMKKDNRNDNDNAGPG